MASGLVSYAYGHATNSLIVKMFATDAECDHLKALCSQRTNGALLALCLFPCPPRLFVSAEAQDGQLQLRADSS